MLVSKQHRIELDFIGLQKFVSSWSVSAHDVNGDLPLDFVAIVLLDGEFGMLQCPRMPAQTR